MTDFFIVNVAIPSLQRDLHAGTAAIQWVVAGFGLAVAAVLITASRLGDAFGRRRVFIIGLAAFTFRRRPAASRPWPACWSRAGCCRAFPPG